MKNKLSEFFINLLTGLTLLSLFAFLAMNTYHVYATIQFQQKMILELEYKCGWYIDDKEEK